MTELPPPDGVPGRLPPGEVQVWLVRLDTIGQQWPEWERVLSPEERSKADRFVRPEDRHRSAATRAILRRLLGHYLDVPPTEVRFSYNSYGKPAVAPGMQRSAVAFSLAHSAEWLLLGFASRGPLGVDCETAFARTAPDALMRQICAPGEYRAWALLPSERRDCAFRRSWVLKEAYLKALGVGLSLAPDRVRIVFEDAGCTPVLAMRGRWFVSAVDVPGGEGVVVAAPARSRLVVHRWPGAGPTDPRSPVDRG